MDARFTAEDEAFRHEFSDWLSEHLRGDFEVVKGRGGPGDEHALFEERHAWEKLSGGRKKGEQNINSHYRKAKIGDWKSFLQGESLSRFNEISADLIPVLGYDY